MTTEIYEPPPTYTVQGVGPYAITHEYHAASELIVTAGDVTLVLNVDYTVSPTEDATAGSVTLSADAAALHDEAALRIVRATVVEQGYAAQGGEREAGLEVQLDRLTRGVQDVSRAVSLIDSSIIRVISSPDGDGYVTFTTVAAAEAGTVAAAEKAIRLLGRASEHDKQGGIYWRQSAEPAHLVKVQTADGAWWSPERPSIRLTEAGGIDGGTVDASAALSAAAAYAVETGAVVLIDGHFLISAHMVFPKAFVLRGQSGFRGADVAAGKLTFAAGAGLEWLHPDGEDTTINGLGVANLVLEDAATTALPADKQSFDPVPLLTCHRAMRVRIDDVTIRGADRRRMGAWLGRGNTIWNSLIQGLRVMDCQLGLWLGGDNDATHNYLVASTFDHCQTGIIFDNPVAGACISCSVENCTGAVAIGYRSTATRAKAHRLAHCYVLNCGPAVPDPTSAAVQIGGVLPDTDWDVAGVNVTSTSEPWTMSVVANYLACPLMESAVAYACGRYSEIRRNLVQTAGAGTGVDFINIGTSGNTAIDGNVRQGDTKVDQIAPGSTYHRSLRVNQDGDLIRTLRNVTMASDAVVAIGDVAQIDAAGITTGVDTGGWKFSGRFGSRAVTGAAGVATTIFNMATDFPQGAGNSGFGKLFVAIEQGSGAHQSVIEITIHGDLRDAFGVVDTAAGFVVTQRIPGARDGEVIAMSGSSLQITRISGFQASISMVLVDFPFSD